MSAQESNISDYLERCKCCLGDSGLQKMWGSNTSGEKEVFGELFMECFALSWEAVDTEVICENCVMRLRDAVRFKKDFLTVQEILQGVHKGEIIITIKDGDDLTVLSDKDESINESNSVEYLEIKDQEEKHPEEDIPDVAIKKKRVKRKRQTIQYTLDELENAKRAVKRGMSIMGAAEKYGIPRKTLSMKLSSSNERDSIPRNARRTPNIIRHSRPNQEHTILQPAEGALKATASSELTHENSLRSSKGLSLTDPKVFVQDISVPKKTETLKRKKDRTKLKRNTSAKSLKSSDNKGTKNANAARNMRLYRQRLREKKLANESNNSSSALRRRALSGTERSRLAYQRKKLAKMNSLYPQQSTESQNSGSVIQNKGLRNNADTVVKNKAVKGGTSDLLQQALKAMKQGAPLGSAAGIYGLNKFYLEKAFAEEVTAAEEESLYIEEEEKKTRYFMNLRMDLQEVLRVLLIHTSVLPFRRKNNSFQCAYCNDLLATPKELHSHSKTYHAHEWNTTDYMLGAIDDIVRMDTIDLKCTTCRQKLAIKNIHNHFANVHKITLQSARKRIIFYDLSEMKCVLCFEVFQDYNALDEHMFSHYFDYICECGSRFISQKSLERHQVNHRNGLHKCGDCKKNFNLEIYLAMHLRLRHSNQALKCLLCDKKFPNRTKRETHFNKFHKTDAQEIMTDYYGRIITDYNKFHKTDAQEIITDSPDQHASQDDITDDKESSNGEYLDHTIEIKQEEINISPPLLNTDLDNDGTPTIIHKTFEGSVEIKVEVNSEETDPLSLPSNNCSDTERIEEDLNLAKSEKFLSNNYMLDFEETDNTDDESDTKSDVFDIEIKEEYIGDV